MTLAVGALCVDPDLDRQERTLSLRLRAPGEIVRLATRLGGELLTRASAALDRDEVPAVAAGPRDSERISDDERRKLDRLIEEKLRE